MNQELPGRAPPDLAPKEAPFTFNRQGMRNRMTQKIHPLLWMVTKAILPRHG